MSRPDASGAFEDLAARARTLSTQVQRGRYDRLLLIVGGLLLPLGLLLIVLAWLGASHTVLVFEQIPYLISGGLLGLGLVIVGGFVYFAYWQTLLVREGRDQARRVEGLLERIEAHLSEATTARFPAEANGPAAAGPRTPARASAGPMRRRYRLRRLPESPSARRNDPVIVLVRR